tara:strand:+ start:1152 stop:1691 length:540 start_codon:yes stop_codon:yes gene_type:complete
MNIQMLDHRMQGRISYELALRISGMIKEVIDHANEGEYDMAQIEALKTIYHPQNIKNGVRGRVMFIAEDNGIAGVAQVKFESDTCVIDNLYVDGNSQGQGIGCALHDAVEIQAKKQGEDTILLHSLMFGKTLEFYRNRGYQERGEKNSIFDGVQVPLMRMEKYLDIEAQQRVEFLLSNL